MGGGIEGESLCKVCFLILLLVELVFLLVVVVLL